MKMSAQSIVSSENLFLPDLKSSRFSSLRVFRFTVNEEG